MAVPSKTNSRLYLQVVLATVVWGGAYPFTKYLVTEISPVTIVTLRALIGSLLLVPLTGSGLRGSDFKFGNVWKIFLMSVLGVSAQQYLQAYALAYTSANHAGWLIASTPILVAAAMAMLGERIGVPRIIAFLLGFIGTLLVVFSKARPGAGGMALPAAGADLIFVGTCVAWACYVVMTKKWLVFWRQAKVTTVTMLLAAATMLPVWVWSGGVREIGSITPKGWLCLGYLSVLSSALAYLFWNNSVEGLGPVRSSYFIYIEPFATLLSAYLLINEPVAPAAFAGGLLIMLGVYFVNLDKGSGPAAVKAAERMCGNA
ncbi:MAG: DMT family transporter [Elusimicrobiales bacterium]|jgi:drug/metabolite transporter (DMT)-like permease